MKKQPGKKHQRTLRRCASAYKSYGYKIYADLKGYRKPRLIYGRRPDLIAKKGKKEVILEVETKRSYKKDTKQRRAFERYASRNKNRVFREKIAK